MTPGYLLYGQNLVDLQERLSTICSELDPAGFGTTTLDLSDASTSDIDEALHANPFFGGVRVAVLKNPSLSKKTGVGGLQSVEWDILLPLLETTPSTTAIVVTVNANMTTRSRPVAFAKKAGWTTEHFSVPRGRDLVNWVTNRVELQTASVDADASRLLVSRLFPVIWERETRYDTESVDMQLLATEIDKLVTASIDGVITKQNISDLVHDRSGVTAFKLNDAIFAGRPEQALEELDNALSSGEVPERVIAQIGREITVLYAATCSDNYGPQEIADASDISSGQISMTVSRKSGWRKLDALKWSAEALRNAEWMVKTGRSPRTASVIVPLAAGIASRFQR